MRLHQQSTKSIEILDQSVSHVSESVVSMPRQLGDITLRGRFFTVLVKADLHIRFEVFEGIAECLFEFCFRNMSTSFPISW